MPKNSIAKNKTKYHNFFRFSPKFVRIHVAISQILQDTPYSVPQTVGNSSEVPLAVGASCARDTY